MNAPSAKRESIVVLAITVVACVVRLWFPDRLGLDHFDEGIYALSGLWSQNPKGLWALDPVLIPYAPPGVPILIGIAYAIFGVSDVAAILVSIVSGSLTIAAVGWVGRRSFGPGAGAAAAGLAALSGTHLLFSRMALTEATFLLAWVMGLGVGGRILEKPTLGRGLMLGLIVGLAMNLKYNGWLIGVLVAVTAVLDAVFNPQRRARTALLRTFGFGMVGAGLAIVMYLPWYQFVERNGGYAGLVAHHRSYLGGPATWLPHWHQQLANIKALSGTPYWPLAAWCLGCSGLGLVIWNRDSLWENKTGRVWLITALGYGGIVFAIWPTSGWWMPLLALPWVLSLGSSARLLGVGWLTLSVMTPFYHPYARLWLPLHAFSWLIVGGGLREVWIVSLGNVPAVGNSRNSRGTWTLGIVLAALLSAAFEMTGVTRPSPLPNPNGLYPISWTQSELANARTMYGPATGAIHVYARPSVLFYLMTTAKQPIYRSTSAEAALMSSNPADYTLLDTAVFTAEDFDKVSMAPSFGWQQPLSPVSWLDVDPAAAYGQTTRSRAQLIFWATSLIRNHVGLGRPVATPPITPASPSAP